jgi:toxin YoeB
MPDRYKFEVEFTKMAFEELEWWKKHNLKIYEKIKQMVRYIVENFPPKLYHPKALTGEFAGYIRLKITSEHRLIYRIKDGKVRVIRCKDHYNDK